MKESKFKLTLAEAPLLMAYGAMLGMVMAKVSNLLVAFFATMFH